MIDHISIGVRDLDRAKRFYDAALKPLGYTCLREADIYVVGPLERLVEAVLFTKPEERNPERIAKICANLRAELSSWETAIAGDFLAGPLSAADFTLYPVLALVRRMQSRNPGLIPADLAGPKVADWMRRMDALPLVQKTWPPHWR